MVENVYNILGTVCIGLAIMFCISLFVVEQIKKFSEVKKTKYALVNFFTIGILVVIMIILQVIIQESLLTITIHTIMLFMPLILLSYYIMLCMKTLKDQRSIDDKAREGKNINGGNIEEK